MESAADTSDGLSQVPLTLATESANIFAALSGTLESFVVNEEMEDKLIHFAYAKKRRAKNPLPAKYRAKTAAEYMAEFKWFNTPAVVVLYSQLCEYVHAASPSVHMYLEESDRGTVTVLRHKLGVDLPLPRDLPSVLQPVAMLAFTAPLVILGVMNYFPIATLHAPEAAPQVLSGIPLWAKVERAFRER
jgi:hypothetical protein